MNTAQMHEHLARRDRELKRLVEDADMAVLLTTLEGRTVLANEHAATLLGYSVSELCELPSIKLFHREERGVVVDRISRFNNGEIMSPAFTTRCLSKDKEEIPVEFIGLPVKWKGETASLNFVRDLTLQDRLEKEIQAAQKLQSVGTLAGGVAHDFNNLLMTIGGNVSLMLLDIDESNPHYERLTEIEEQVRSGARLANQLLGYARQGKHEQKLLDLRKVVDQTAETFGRTRKDVTIYKHFDGDCYPILADRDSIERVLLNVYINAGDAMPNGGTLDLKLECTDRPGLNVESGEEGGRYVHLTVTDSGHGMDDKVIERVFEPFFTTKEVGKGTGLGLSSAYGIVKRHNGYIEIRSSVGEGTTVDLYLPASEEEPSDSLKGTRESQQDQATILLVDDEKSILDLGERMLSRMGHKVIPAGSGKGALETYKQCGDEIDLVILDMIMPEIRGEEVYRELKAMDPDVTVLICSGFSIEAGAREILADGRNGFIQKPFNMQELSTKVLEMLGQDLRPS